MSQTIDIGAARVSLIVDAAEFEPVIAQGKNALTGFATAAEQAYDRQTKAQRRASDQLLDYVNQLKRMGTSADAFRGLDNAAASMDKLVRKAARVGVDKNVLDAAASAWQQYAQQVQHAGALQENVDRDALAAAAAIKAQETALEQLVRTERLHAAALQENQARDRNAAADAAKRASIEAQITLYDRLEQAAAEAAAAERAQASINARTGVGAASGAGSARDQRALIAELERQVKLEAQIESEAHDINRELDRWKLQINSIGKDYYELAKLNAVQRFGADNAKPILAEIDALKKLNTTISGTTVNTKQLQQAIRFLPAQFTDIGVSLAGGMNPLLVLFQQGGQILDQFRLSGVGTVDTLKMIGSYALRLVNPWTVATATVAAFAYAGYDAAKSMEELSIATAKGFGTAGNAEDLYALAESLNRIENVRLGPAEEAIARLAAGGKLAGDNFDLAAEATARWASVTGEKADQVAGVFESIARDPLKAMQDGLVRVTEEQYNQVKALVDMGREQDAVNQVTRIYYDTVNGNAASVEAHLSGVSRLLHEIKDGFGEVTRAAGEMANGLADFIADATKARNEAAANAGFFGKLLAYSPVGAYQALYNAKPKPADNPLAPLAPTMTPRQLQQQAELDRLWQSSGTKAQQYSLAVTKLTASFSDLTAAQLAAKDITRNADGTYGGAGFKRLTDSLKDKFKDPKKSGGVRAASAAKEVRAQYEAELAALQTQTRGVEAEYRLQTISASAYYDALVSLAKRERDTQLESNNAQLAAIQGRKGSEQEVARLRASNLIVEERLQQRLIDLDTQRTLQLRQIADAHKQYAWALQDTARAQQENIDATVARMTMGDREFERSNAIIEMQRAQARAIEELDRKVKTNQMTVEDAEIDKAAVIEATTDAIRRQAAGYAAMDAAQADWSNGARKAWQDWQAEVQDVSGNAQKVFSAALDGMAENITNTLTGSENTWADYFDSIARMITNFIVKQQLTKWLESISKSGQNSSGSGGWWDKAAGFVAGLLGGASGGGATASAGSSYTSWIGSGYAYGGVPGAAGLAAHRNSVVSQPTVFPFAAGGVPNYGLMGERSGLPYEAIMPLRRTSSGNLGVEVTGRGKGGNVINIKQDFHVQGTPDRATRDQLRRDNASETQRAVSKV